MQIVYTNEGTAAATTLEAKWKAYLPQFSWSLAAQPVHLLQHRRRDQLVGVGQYSQAVALLTPAIAFLQQTPNTKRASEAQGLLSKARAGSEAEARVRDAQQALEENDYARTKMLLDQARELYRPSGRETAAPSIQYQQRADRASGDR